MRSAISPRLAIRIFFGFFLTTERSIVLLPQSGRPPVVGRLLVREGEPQERFLAPRAAEELQAGRQTVAARVTHRDGDRGKAGARREELVVVAARRIEIANEPRRVAPRRI